MSYQILVDYGSSTIPSHWLRCEQPFIDLDDSSLYMLPDRRKKYSYVVLTSEAETSIK